jgi:hypothetical protein
MPILNPAWCYCFVLGPSTGETILVRIPDEHWLVIDSFVHEGRPAAERILDEHGANWECLLLTHPHADHYGAFDLLLDRNPEGIVGCVHPAVSAESGEVLPMDLLAHLGQGAVPVYDAIQQRWAARRHTRWETFRGSRCELGEAILHVLHPPSPVPPPAWDGDRNKLSSAILMKWRKLTLLLAGDVVNPKWHEMALATTVFGSLGNHAAMKVPHHGSKGAYHESYAEGNEGRTWVATPFASSGLPKADDGHGLDLLLQHVPEIQITALPFAHDCEHEAPCTVTRVEVRDEIRPRPTQAKTLPNGKRGRVPALSNSVERRIVMAFDDTGTLRDLHYGRGTVRVTR